MNINLIILILGATLVIEGIPYLLFPQGIKRFFKRIESTDNKTIRILGLVTSLIGLSLVYFFGSKI
jgi:uncharacterized protein YjeT (DUF2065 family)